MKALMKSTSPTPTRRSYWSRPIFAAIVAVMVISPAVAQVEDVELITPESEWRYNDSGAELVMVIQALGLQSNQVVTKK
jgi:hypothetical protein